MTKECGVHITISADSPFLQRVTSGHNDEVTYHSDCGLWIPDPNDAELKALMKYHKLKISDLKEWCFEDVQSDLCDINAFFPSTAFYDKKDPDNPRNGYRTQIKFKTLDSALSGMSLVYLPSVAYICPDGAHCCPRMVEKDLKLIFEFLLVLVSFIKYYYVFF
mgnify:CR=1 FL=1